MTVLNFIGYIENSFSNGFQIPIFESADGDLYFQQISSDNIYIENFQLINKEYYKFEIVYVENKIPKSSLDFAIYVIKFNGNLYIGPKPVIKQYARLFFSLFNPNENLFFLRDYLTLLKEFRYNLIKLFYRINQSEFHKDELLDYMSLIFGYGRLKMEKLLLEQLDNKVRVLQLFEVKSVRSDYFKFLMAHKMYSKAIRNYKPPKLKDKVYYELFNDPQNIRKID